MAIKKQTVEGELVEPQPDSRVAVNIECEDGSVVSVDATGATVFLRASGLHAPLSPSAKLTLAEAEELQKALGKACAKVRGAVARG